MAVSKYPSEVTIPIGYRSKNLLEFMVSRFRSVSESSWLKRFDEGLVLNSKKEVVDKNYPALPGEKIFYYKVVEGEPVIPFQEKKVFENELFLIACKPHFLPVIPAGKYLNESLLYRLRDKTGVDELSPANRIDRETAGLVMFVKDKKYRGAYQKLFMDNRVKKEYEAVCLVEKGIRKQNFTVKSRIVTGEPFFRMRSVDGEDNSETLVHVVKEDGRVAFVKLNPVTGRKHQLRVHLSDCGLPIMNDRFYPYLMEEKTDFENPLQLLSKVLSFKDPVTGEKHLFVSERKLEAISK